MAYIKSALNRLLHGVESTQLVIGTIGLLASTFLIFAQVLNRYWLNIEIMWLGDLALYIFIFFMFIAAAVATWQESHVAVDAFREKITRLKPTLAAAYRVLLTILSIAVLAVFMPLMYQFMLRAMKYPEWGTLARFFNESWLQIGAFIAMALVMMHLLIIARRDISELIRNLVSRSRKEKT